MTINYRVVEERYADGLGLRLIPMPIGRNEGFDQSVYEFRKAVAKRLQRRARKAAAQGNGGAAASYSFKALLASEKLLENCEGNFTLGNFTRAGRIYDESRELWEANVMQ